MCPLVWGANCPNRSDDVHEARGHHLAKLFNVIPEDVRSDLQHAYNAHAIQHLPNSFDDTLKQYERLFLDSRYPYEADADITKYSVNPLMELIDFLAEFVGSRAPREWIHWS